VNPRNPIPAPNARPEHGSDHFAAPLGSSRSGHLRSIHGSGEHRVSTGCYRHPRHRRPPVLGHEMGTSPALLGSDKARVERGGDSDRHRLGGPPYPTVHLRTVGAGGGLQHDTRDRIGADDSSDPCRWLTRSCWGLRQLSLCTSHGARRGSVGARGCDRRKEESSEMLGGDPRMNHAMRDRLSSSPMYAWSWDRQNRDSRASDGSSTTLERCE
jgi:hypothetical protein